MSWCAAGAVSSPRVGGTSGGGFPNEPGDHSVITEREFTAYEEDGWGNNGTGNYTVPHTDAGDPLSPSNVGRSTFSGSGGTAPHNTFKSFTATDTLYVAFTFKISDNWQGHDSGVNKILFITAGDYGGGGDPVYFSAQGIDDGALNFQVRLQGPGDEGSTVAGANIGANLGGGGITRDTWYTIEVLLIANTGANNDGEVHVWIDDSKTHQRTDVMFFDEDADSSAHKFDNIKWNPTWGGTGDTVIETMYQYVGHIRVSGP